MNAYKNASSSSIVDRKVLETNGIVEVPVRFLTARLNAQKPALAKSDDGEDGCLHDAFRSA
jgi:hypothetical protein